MVRKKQTKKTTKTEEAKAPVEKTLEKKVEAEKVEEKKVEAKEVKKEPVKKEPAKKVTTRKTPAKKEVKTDILVQYGEKEVNTKDMIAAVKKEWTKTKHKVAEIKSIELYIKPEDYAVYYVINGDTTGKVWM